MRATDQHHALTPARERATLLALGAVQFTHFLDFMIMMPLGAQLMRVFGITPAQFTHLVASYGFAAAVSGFAGGFVLDRYDRKRALLFLYGGFAVATLACGLAQSHGTLILARIAAGSFGGLAGSMVNAMVGDVIPNARRGRAMSIVAGAWPVSLVVGVPMALWFAGKFGWQAPFYFLAACAALVLPIAAGALPHIRTAVHDHQPLRQMREIWSHRVHLWAFALAIVLVIAGGIVIPFLAPSFVLNVGLDEHSELPLVYVAGGIATAISTPLVGWLSDRIDRLRVLGFMSIGAAIMVVAVTRLGPSSVLVASLLMAAFMVTMSGRFAPAMAMIAGAVEQRYRGGFMSITAALQQAASAGATVVAGEFVTRDASGQLRGVGWLGWISVCFFVLTVMLASRLRAAAPHVSEPGRKPPIPVAEAEPEATIG